MVSLFPPTDLKTSKTHQSGRARARGNGKRKITDCTDHTDRPKSKPSDADRQRDYRLRVSEGDMILRIRVGPKVVKALLVSERLTDKESRNRKRVSTELAAVLMEWSERWK